MSAGAWEWHLGLARAALLAAPGTLVGWRATARLAGLERALGAAVAALAFATVATLGAGVAGVLAFGPLVALELALAAPLLYLSRRQEPATGPAAAPAALAAPVAVALPALALSLARGLLAPPTNWDTLSYHLPFAVHWLQTGSLRDHLLLPAYPAQVTFFPGGGELAWCWTLIAWGDDALAGAVNHGFLLLACAAIAALALHLGARPAAAATGAAVFALMPIQSASILGTANVDLYLAFAMLTCALFLVHEGGAHAWLAALAAGLALGAKLSGVVLVPLALALGLAGGWRPRPGALLAGAALAALVGGFWYARNGLATGNPLYPLGSARLEAAESWVDEPARAGGLRGLAEAVWAMLGVAAPAVTVGWVAHLARGRRALDRAVAVAGAALVAGWSLTPNTAHYVAYNLRYALPGLALGAVSLACALSGSAASAETLGATGAALAGVQLLLSAPHLALPARWTLTALSGLALGALAVRARGLRLALTVALLNLLAFQLFVEHHQPRTRLAWFLAEYHGGLMRRVAEWADAQDGATVMLCGPLPPYYLYGARLQNRVVMPAPGALATAGADWLVISREDTSTPFPPEDGGARARPDRYRLASDEPTVRIYRVAP